MGGMIPTKQTILYLVICLIAIASMFVLYKKHGKKRKKVEILSVDAKELKLRISKIDETIKKLKKNKVDTSNLEVELELVTEKLNQGMLRMANEYLLSLEKKITAFKRKGLKMND